MSCFFGVKVYSQRLKAPQLLLLLLHLRSKQSPLNWQLLRYKQTSKPYVTKLMHEFLLVFLSKAFPIANVPVSSSAPGNMLVNQAIQILNHQLISLFLEVSIVNNSFILLVAKLCYSFSVFCQQRANSLNKTNC